MKNTKIFNTTMFDLLRIIIDDPHKDNPIKATNLVNFGIIIVNETGNLVTSDIDGFMADYIINSCGSSNGIFNNHFHKTWNKVADAPIDILVEEQLMHYFSTYGMELLTGTAMPMIPVEKCLPEWALPDTTNKFVVVRLVSYETANELFIKKMTTVMKPSVDEFTEINTILKIYKENLTYPIIDVNEIKSFEIIGCYCGIGDIVPSDPQTFLRCAVYYTIGKTLIVKNDETIRAIKYNSQTPCIEQVVQMFKKADLVGLSTIFFRYKPIFLAFKANKDIAPIINKIRRLADRYHRPLPDITVANAISLIKQNRLTDVANLFEKMTLRNAIKLYNYGLNAMSENEDVIYNIRNGKAYITSHTTDKICAETLKSMSLTAIISKLNGRFEGKTFYIPENVDYKVPVSEKQMLSNIPYGTTIRAEGDHDALCISIAWENYKDIRTDIDLHLNSVKGSFGWNSNWRSDDGSCEVLYSGDMTDATNGATESFRVGINPETLYLANVHLYSGDNNCPFRVFLSSGDDFRKCSVGMVEIDKALSAPIKLDFKAGNSLSLGYLYGDTFTFYGGCLSNTIVPLRDLYVKALNAIMSRCSNMMSLRDLINYGGGKIVTELTDDAIDFSPENVLSQSFFELID